MARLRLFAAAREAAGSASVEIDATTVEQVLSVAVARFGTTFEAVLGQSRVWVNGEEAGPGDRVGADDEVAVLPPVSGGRT
jgi:molybdopterin converting factor small subunit